MSNNKLGQMKTEAKIFSCTQSEVLAEQIAKYSVFQWVKLPFRITAMENFNLHSKNPFVDLEYS